MKISSKLIDPTLDDPITDRIKTNCFQPCSTRKEHRDQNPHNPPKLYRLKKGWRVWSRGKRWFRVSWQKDHQRDGKTYLRSRMTAGCVAPMLGERDDGRGGRGTEALLLSPKPGREKENGQKQWPLSTTAKSGKDFSNLLFLTHNFYIFPIWPPMFCISFLNISTSKKCLLVSCKRKRKTSS